MATMTEHQPVPLPHQGERHRAAVPILAPPTSQPAAQPDSGPGSPDDGAVRYVCRDPRPVETTTTDPTTGRRAVAVGPCRQRAVAWPGEPAPVCPDHDRPMA